MKIQELTNNSQDVLTDKLEELRDSIASDFCRDAIAAQKLLYRDVSARDRQFFTQTTVSGRRPLGQTIKSQKVLDAILTQTGFKSLRNNSICCIPELNSGIVWISHMIFPHNGYAFTWSSKINDIGSNTELLHALKKLESPTDTPTNITLDNASEFIKQFAFCNSNMVAALNSKNEITINGTYTAIRIDYISQVSRVMNIAVCP